MSDVGKYLLAGVEPSDDRRFAAPPPRLECKLEVLIDGVATFRAMERAIVSAKKSVYLSFWIFNPATPLLAPDVRRTGASTWADLLRSVAARGVQVRILLSDFDPIIRDALHASNWHAYHRLVAEAGRLGVSARNRMQTMVTRHPATVSFLLGGELATRLATRVRTLNGKTGVDIARLRTRPGLWTLLDYNTKTKRVTIREEVPLAAFPATHHQKICVVDDVVALSGGLDVNTGRIDNPAHQSDRTAWHDLHTKLEGAAALDIARNFIGRWNDERAAFLNFRDEANKAGMPTSLPAQAITTLSLTATRVTAAGTSAVQVHRTMSSPSLVLPVPTTVVDDVARAYEHAITNAERYIYIENQYVRSLDLRDWIIKRTTERTDLVVIVVLPVAPEEVGAKGGADPITEHGLHLQHEVLTSLAATLGSHFGMFSMVQRKRAPRHATDSFGSRQIYLHSKCLIVDDVVALIGSANANPRSFQVDTELNVGWYDPALVPKFRVALWSELLGSPKGMATWKPADYVSKWAAIATANKNADPTKRKGFVVRHDPARFPGKKGPWYLPDAFASVFDPETDREALPT